MRVWILSAVGVGAVVAAILNWPQDKSAAADDGAGRRTRPDLSEKEVRTYLDVHPALTAALRKIANEIGEAWEKEGQYPKDPKYQQQARLAKEGTLREAHLHGAEWETLRRRVEYVVQVLRAEEGLEASRNRWRAELELKRPVHHIAKGRTREMLANEIAVLEANIAATTPSISERDRTLARKYWQDLDRTVPVRKSALK